MVAFILGLWLGGIFGALAIALFAGAAASERESRGEQCAKRFRQPALGEALSSAVFLDAKPTQPQRKDE